MVSRIAAGSIAVVSTVISLAAGSAWAVPEVLPPSEETPWYQVNIVIFKQPGHLLQSEQWKTGDEVDTRLPSRIISLEDPTQVPDETAEPEDPAQATQPAIADNAIVTLTEAGAAGEIEAEIPRPFIIQPPTDEEFTKALNRISRSPNYEILYQKSWLQPPLEEKDAMAVLVQAGEVHDGFYELEGTARLHVSRYLHFSGNLWLSKYVQQIEVVKPWWQESTGINNSEADNSNSGDFTIDLGSSMAFENGSDNSNELSLSSLQPMDTSIAMGETITRYKSIRTGVMSESRRMRSGELHYLDHPLFGVMVKVVPYFPEPEEATSEGNSPAVTR